MKFFASNMVLLAAFGQLFPCEGKLGAPMLDTEDVRILESLPLIAACDNPERRFKPNPFQYYTIAEPKGLGYLSHEKEKSVKKEEIDMNLAFTDDLTSSHAHWRFNTTSGNPLDQDGTPVFFLYNRFTGVSLASAEGTADSDDGLPQVAVECDATGTSVKISLVNPIKVENELLSVYVSDIDVAETHCVDRDKQCEQVSTFDNSYRTIGMRRSNCFFTHARLKCARSLRSEVQSWVIDEVRDFNRLSGPSLAPAEVVVGTPPLLSGERVAGAIAQLGSLGFRAAGCGICGGIFAQGVALGMAAFGGKSENQKVLDDLASDILSVTEDMITNALVSASLREAANALEEQRSFFYDEYLQDKKIALSPTGSINRVLILAGSLGNKLFAYNTEIARYFGSLDEGQSDTNIKTAFLAFDFLTYSMMESLALRREVYLLDALGNPEFSCAELGRNLQKEADDFRDLLIATQELLVHQRVEINCCGTKRRTFRIGGAEGTSDLIIDDDEVILQDTRLGPFDEVLDAVARVEQEREIDIRHLSFPIQAFLEYFEKYGETTIAACDAIRSDPVERAQFENDSLDADAVCGVESDSCTFDSDCCSKNCADSFCAASP